MRLYFHKQHASLLFSFYRLQDWSASCTGETYFIKFRLSTILSQCCTYIVEKKGTKGPCDCPLLKIQIGDEICLASNSSILLIIFCLVFRARMLLMIRIRKLFQWSPEIKNSASIQIVITVKLISFIYY